VKTVINDKQQNVIYLHG